STAPTEFYTLSLHDALPIWKTSQSDCWCANDPESAPSFLGEGPGVGTARRWRISLKFSLGVLSLSTFLGGCGADAPKPAAQAETDRKSTRLNSSHVEISYAV